MVKGLLTQFKIPERSYPRFKYHRDRLTSITQRLENLINPGKLAECISQGTHKLKGIRQLTEYLKEDVKIVVSTNLKLDDTLLDQLQVYKGAEIQGDEKSAIGKVGGDTGATTSKSQVYEKTELSKDVVTETSVFESLKSSVKFQPYFIVFHVPTISLQSDVPLISQIQLLDKALLENVIVHAEDSNCSYSLVELQACNFDVNQIKHTARYKKIGCQIQFILEDRIAEVLENIADFVRKFCPKEGEEVLNKLERECGDQIQESFKCQPIMDDLNPEIILTQEEKLKMDGEKRQFTHSELNAVFHKQLLHFLSQKTKVIVCDQLSKKYGISASLVNEFMNEGFFDYDKSYREAVSKLSLPNWESMQRRNHGVMICYSFVNMQSSFFQKVEDYIKKVLKHLQTLEKLNYEVYGLLRRMEVPVQVDLPKYPSVPARLQEELLRHSDIVGCGTIYGKLGIHIKNAEGSISQELKSDIKEILDRHHYNYGFKIQKMKSFDRHADRRMDVGQNIESGDQLCSTILNPEGEGKSSMDDKEGKMVGNNKIGTLGCFIGLKTADAPEAMEVEGASGSSDGAKLYGITCAHCVTDCSPTVNVHCPESQAFKNTLGETDLVLDNKYQIDIAAVKVRNMCYNDCDCSISLQQHWNLYPGGAGDDVLSAQKVLKRGAITKTTEGIVVSNDYRRYGAAHNRGGIINRGNELGFNFDASYTILIDDIQGIRPALPVFAQQGLIQQEEHTFSKKGDSGSVVFYHNPTHHGNGVVVVSLLEGAINLEEGPCYSYSCHLKSSLQELCRLNQLEFVMPWEL